MKGRKGNANARRSRIDPAKRKRAPATAATATAAAKPPRKPKSLKAFEQRARAAQDRAAQFAQTQQRFEMPPFVAADPQYRGVAAVWRYYAPLLQERHFWEPEYIAPFLGFCVYYDEFLAADRDVKQNGFGVTGVSVSGGDRFWKNPAVDVRDHAYARVLELSTRFGFTPLDLYKLERESAAASSTRPVPPSAKAAQQPEATEQLPLPGGEGSPLAGGPGALAQFDGEPPTSTKQ